LPATLTYSIMLTALNVIIAFVSLLLNIFGYFSKLPPAKHLDHSYEKICSMQEVASTYSINIIRATPKREEFYESIKTSIFSFFEYKGRMLEDLYLYEEEKYTYENKFVQFILISIVVAMLIGVLTLAISIILMIPPELPFYTNLLVIIILIVLISVQLFTRNRILKLLELFEEKWGYFENRYRQISDLHLNISSKTKQEE